MLMQSGATPAVRGGAHELDHGAGQVWSHHASQRLILKGASSPGLAGQGGACPGGGIFIRQA